MDSESTEQAEETESTEVEETTEPTNLDKTVENPSDSVDGSAVPSSDSTGQVDSNETTETSNFPESSDQGNPVETEPSDLFKMESEQDDEPLDLSQVKEIQDRINQTYTGKNYAMIFDLEKESDGPDLVYDISNIDSEFVAVSEEWNPFDFSRIAKPVNEPNRTNIIGNRPINLPENSITRPINQPENVIGRPVNLDRKSVV